MIFNINLFLFILQGYDVYKFWEVEENIKLVMKNIFEMIKKDIEEEFFILKNFVSNF